MPSAVGSPAWVDLATTDPGNARDFYTGLFGWTWRRQPDYSVAFAAKTPVAGILEPVAEMPTVWTLYLECGSVQRAADHVHALGGQVLIPPTETPADETFLVARDPSGAVVGLWQAPPGATFGRDHAGMLCWAELHTRDASSADPFYADLLGYRQEQIGEPGGEFDYTVWYVDDMPTAGRFDASAALPTDLPPHWQLYFQVNPDQDTDSAVERAVVLGGKVLREPSDSPHGRLAQLQDVVGAPFFVIDTALRTGE
ncbi:VOC family protein [Saccharopolyspora erythraea]|uniref:VOC family protein n=1 Tax=Saccharopolyspora erythraea TaxID=1836 RepID=UPI001BA5F802|nr:VOC family protein [Saccharopolyspora erythraea]QUH04486.1 VOC family protein [Saccharopolyspora erythraea]